MCRLCPYFCFKGVDYELVTAGDTDENSIFTLSLPLIFLIARVHKESFHTNLEILNAKYAINVARKLGCCVFLLPEDIMEVKSKLLLTFVGALISVDI